MENECAYLKTEKLTYWIMIEKAEIVSNNVNEVLKGNESAEMRLDEEREILGGNENAGVPSDDETEILGNKEEQAY